MSTKNVYEGVKSIFDKKGAADAQKSVLGFVDNFVDNAALCGDVGMWVQSVQAAVCSCGTNGNGNIVLKTYFRFRYEGAYY